MSKNTNLSSSHSRQTKKETFKLNQPVFFVGFMGAGKTTISRIIARRYGLTSIDMDSYIVRQEGCSVNELFDNCGEKGFRDIETQLLRKLANGEPMLISCGGGIVVTPDNQEILKQNGCVVFLKTTAAQSKERISNLSSRPLFNNLEDAERRNLERMPLYEEVANITVDVIGKSKNEISREVTRKLFDYGALAKKPTEN